MDYVLDIFVRFTKFTYYLCFNLLTFLRLYVLPKSAHQKPAFISLQKVTFAKFFVTSGLNHFLNYAALDKTKNR